MEIIYNIKDIKSIAEKLKSILEDKKVVTLTGSLGAGKTTLVKEILKSYGVKEITNSPTFNYVNRYNINNLIINHFDLYRVKDIAEIYDMGFIELINAENSLNFIEWPEVIKPALPKNSLNIVLDYYGEKDFRKISCK